LFITSESKKLDSINQALGGAIKMLKQILSLAIVSLGFSFPAIDSSLAGMNCVTQACKAARLSAEQPAVPGRKAPTNVPMVCANAYAIKKISEVVWVEGSSVNGPVLSRQRAKSVKWKHFANVNGTDIFVGESCIPASKVQNLEDVTVCNGIKAGEGNHTVLHRSSIKKALNGKRLEVSLLGTKLTAEVEKYLD
jgi:hypothetical protein